MKNKSPLYHEEATSDRAGFFFTQLIRAIQATCNNNREMLR